MQNPYNYIVSDLNQEELIEVILQDKLVIFSLNEMQNEMFKTWENAMEDKITELKNWFKMKTHYQGK